LESSAEPQTSAEHQPSEEPQPSAEDQVRRLRNGVVTLIVLVALAAGLLLAVPGLHGVAHTLVHMAPGWVLLALAFEVASCLGYVLIFVTVFDRAPLVFGARVALTGMAFGAAVPIGGTGALAISAWLMHERGVPTGQIAERSGVLFLLTSAINAVTLIGCGLLLGLGILPGGSNPLLTLLPAGVGIAVFVFLAVLPALTERTRMAHGPGRVASLLRGIATTIRETKGTLLRPNWRIAGAFAYLWFDMAVLWACFRATGHAPPIAVIALAYQIGYLVNVLPIPGSLGVLEGSFVGMFVLFHINAIRATAAAVVYHAIALWIPVIWGTIAFVRLRQSGHEPYTPRPSREERRAAARSARTLSS
jgi:uncharacterized membrane protein YbhN (UPF0104 family)